ncbi:MAG: DUF2867 domain-containing protein [Catenulispora sp.]|nr:DUF2867 domain-containing protein [Catenulispora sp.]
MRLTATDHTTRPWLIHEIAPDFRLEDVWALPTPGGPGGFPALIAVLDHSDFERDAPPAARALWVARWTLGALLGWDRKRDGLGKRVPSLRDRLPAELQEAARTRSAVGRTPFRFLYQRDDEFAAEIANRTMHGVLHLSWVPDDSADGEDGWRGQMAILVKPNGVLGAVYMAGIKPFRYRIVYPAMLRSWERQWERHWERSSTV